MMLALEEAYSGIKQGHGGPFGAVIVKGPDVIAAAHNTVLLDNDPTQHAEVRVISAAARKIGAYSLKGCVIYSTTEPCPMCFSAIHWAGLDEVIFGTLIEDVRVLGFNELTISADRMRSLGGSNVLIKPGFMRDECLSLLRYWSEMDNKKTY